MEQGKLPQGSAKPSSLGTLSLLRTKLYPINSTYILSELSISLFALIHLIIPSRNQFRGSTTSLGSNGMLR